MIRLRAHLARWLCDLADDTLRSELAILSAALRATEHQRDEWYACAAGRQARIEALLEEVSDLHAQYSEALGADLDAELCAFLDEQGDGQ